MDHSSRSHIYIDLSSSDEDEEDEFSLAETSDTDEEDDHMRRGPNRYSHNNRLGEETKKFPPQENLANKLMKREYMGNSRRTKSFFANVPTRLSFCLKDLIPPNFIQGQVFMGLSACGQFLLSYKFCSSENASLSHYSFSMRFKYTLFFWIYQPFKPLRNFYKCCLFDDHGVDNMKKVSMIQWKNCDPRILIVHGASEDEHEDSYITYVKVPKLGCLDCKKLREFEEDDGYFRRHILCLKCNLTIHTKYSTTDSDRKFEPNIHLICPERILLNSNGFFHMLHIRLEQAPREQQKQQQQSAINQHQNSLSHLMQRPLNTGDNCNSNINNNNMATSSNIDVPPERCTPISDLTDTFSIDSQSTNSQTNVVARIIEDFADVETDSTHSGSGVISISQLANSLRSSGSSQNDSPISVSRKSCEELIFNCNTNSTSRLNAMSPAAINSATTSTTSSICVSGAAAVVTATNSNTVVAGTVAGVNKNNSSLMQKGPRQRHRIVTKSFRKGVSIFFSSAGLKANITSPNTSTSSNGGSNTSNNSNNDRAAAYEFSEENEKCEKISILRKRRLADRKYEFSEDNSENIIPFTKTRTSNTFSSFLSNTNTGSHSPRHNLTHLHSISPYASPSSSPHTHHPTAAALSPLHRTCTSPLGFRSPPSTSGLVTQSSGGVAGSSVMRSPSRHLVANHFYNNQKSPPHNFAHTLSPATQYMLSFKPHGTLSPLQLSMTKRSHLEVGGSLSPNHQLSVFLSPRRDEYRSVVEVPLQGGAMSEKPVCTKKFLRRFVEEDDAASIITSVEDDCISPGYHILLPMEVHGSCYSEMQMISKASYQQLRCSSVVIEQHSFDMETFTYYAISTLCQKNQKTYDFFYDWAYELINVCPISLTVFCILMAHFSAREEVSSCLNCSRKLSCAFHRREYECRVLFTWNMLTGEWDILDFGELQDYNHYKYSPKGNFSPNVTLQQRAKKLAREMAQTLHKLPDYTSNLRILESNVKKSMKSVTDIDNMIEFSLKKRPQTLD
ncbi:uncharacterized protein LOC135964204 [Calliphora vicina]|uniref:uncharacterized protein LOC135964204 n=1 Tax=Calliphora vicina TaxID=7373 RepID=UPI00325BA5E4